MTVSPTASDLRTLGTYSDKFTLLRLCRHANALSQNDPHESRIMLNLAPTAPLNTIAEG